MKQKLKHFTDLSVFTAAFEHSIFFVPRHTFLSPFSAIFVLPLQYPFLWR